MKAVPVTTGDTLESLGLNSAGTRPEFARRAWSPDIERTVALLNMLMSIAFIVVIALSLVAVMDTLFPHREARPTPGKRL